MTSRPIVATTAVTGVPPLPDEPVRVLVNRGESPVVPTPTGDSLAFHRRLPGYEPTPLRRAPGLAARVGVAEVLIKDETSRFGLPSFKFLGASWAAYRAILRRLEMSVDPQWTLDELAAELSGEPMRVVTATDGNHGRALARFARLVGLEARVFVPKAMVRARVEAIADEGATIEWIDGEYDDAVAAAAASVGASDLLIADTTVDGRDDVAEWVIEGYETIAWELAAQLEAPPDVGLVPIGVGGLAAAIGRCLAPAGEQPTTLLVGVEPHEAASMMASVAAGRVLSLPGSVESMMAGLSCGTPSLAAWPTVRSTYGLFVAVGAETARAGMRALRDAGVAGGECAGGVAGALLQLAARGRTLLPLAADTTVLLIASEGITDPDAYGALVDIEQTEGEGP